MIVLVTRLSTDSDKVPWRYISVKYPGKMAERSMCFYLHFCWSTLCSCHRQELQYCSAISVLVLSLFFISAFCVFSYFLHVYGKTENDRNE